MIKGTIVFQKNWEAINLKCYLVKQKQDNIFEFYILNKATGDYKFLFDKEVDLLKYRLDEYSSISYLCDIKNLKEFGEENLMNRYKYILNSGSSRSSKTVSLIDVYDLYARTHENKRMTVWRDTKKDCKDTVLKDAIKHFRKTGRYGVNQVFNKTESYFMYNTHSTFEINGTDDEEKVHGLTQDCAWLNEPYKIGRDTFDQIDQRTSDFVFVDLNPKKDHWSDDLQKNPRCLRIHSTFKDNPFCPPEQRAKILGYQPVKRTFAVESGLITEHEAMAYDFKENSKNIPEKNLKELLRCVLNVEQRTANIVKWDIYGLGLKAEKPDRIFNWEEIMYHDYLQLDVKCVLYGVDWGESDEFGIVEVKYYDNCLYVHELNYDSEQKWIKKMSMTERNRLKEDGEGFVTWLFTTLNIDKKKEVICDNNRPAKILAVRRAGWERTFATKKFSGSIVDGVDLLNNLQVFYTHTSENIRYEQENYSRSKDSNGKVMQQPEGGADHLIDPIRYVALYLQQIGVIKII